MALPPQYLRQSATCPSLPYRAAPLKLSRITTIAASRGWRKRTGRRHRSVDIPSQSKRSSASSCALTLGKDISQTLLIYLADARTWQFVDQDDLVGQRVTADFAVVDVNLQVLAQHG